VCVYLTVKLNVFIIKWDLHIFPWDLHIFPLRCEGILTGTLEGAVFWEKKLERFIPHGLVVLDGSCTSVMFEPLTRHCLASFRPSKRHPHCRHVVSIYIHV